MIYLTVLLFGRNGVQGEFLAYERKALEIFRRHGGEVIAAYAPDGSIPSENRPDEVQILRMGDRAAFEAFMRDPERVALAAERESVIRKTEVYLSGAPIPY